MSGALCETCCQPADTLYPCPCTLDRECPLARSRRRYGPDGPSGVCSDCYSMIRANAIRRRRELAVYRPVL